MSIHQFGGEVRAEIRRRLAAVIDPARARRIIGPDGCVSVVAGTSEMIADAVLAVIEPYAGFMAEGGPDDDEWIQYTESWDAAAQATETGRVGVVLTLWLPRVDADAPPEETE